MTRSHSDRIEKLEADHAAMRDKLDKQGEKLDAHGAQLSEIAASLAAITAMMARLSGHGSPLRGATEAESSAAGDGQVRGSGDATGTKAVGGMAGRLGAEAATGGQNTTLVMLPPFSGEDPIGWVARAEQQFELHGTLPGKKVAAAVVAMEEAALYWVTWLRARKPAMTWEEFTQALVARFDSRFRGNRFERLAGVKQTGNVEEYVSLFVQLASQVPGLAEEHYLGYFTNGLKGPIRGSLRLLRPNDLETAMELARDIEDNLFLQQGGQGSSATSGFGARASAIPMTFGGSTATGGGGGTLGPSGGVSKLTEQPVASNPELSGQSTMRSRFARIPPKEFDELRAKGLCFRCRKPYRPGHDCPLKQLRVLVAEEDEELNLRQCEYYEVTGEDDPGGVEGAGGDFTAYSMAGLQP